MTSIEAVSTDEEVLRYARSDDLQVEVDLLARPVVETGQTPGMVVGVLLPDGNRRFFAYGVRDKVTRARPDGRTLFPIGSVSKGFVAAAASQLVQAGLLSWDDTLGEMALGKTLSPDARKVTLLQLATHTAGLPRQPNTGLQLCSFLQYLFTGKNFYRHIDREYLLRYLDRFRPLDTTQRHYSNIGLAYLGFAMEHRAGAPTERLVEEYVLKPLGLQRTGYTAENLPGWPDRAAGYAGDQPKFIRRGRPVPEWHFTDALRASVGLYSCAEDLLSFAEAHLRVGSNATTYAALNAALQTRVRGPGFTAAIGWSIDEKNGREFAYHTGVTGGYASYVGLDLEHKAAVVVLQNSLNWTDQVGHRLLLRISRAIDERKGGLQSPSALGGASGAEKADYRTVSFCRRTTPGAPTAGGTQGTR